MKFSRTLLLALVAAVVAGPAAAIAIAGNGPSAGDNQYTDPLSTSTKSTTSAPPPPAATTTTPASSAPAAPTPTPTSTTATGGPTATIASSSSSSTKDPKKTLPMTGYDGWAAALLGAGLLGAGFVVRRRAGAR